MHKKRMKFSGIICVLCAGYLLYSMAVNASEVDNSQDVNSKIQNTGTAAIVIGTARDWGLSDSEWAHYLQLMQGPNGRWYPQLSPAAVLGLNAETDQERKHFAELVARLEHDKVARELVFNHQVYLAMRSIYPAEPVIVPFDKTPFNPLYAHRSQP